MPHAVTRLPVGAIPISSPRWAARADASGDLIPFGDQILDLEPEVWERSTHD
jgi:hypothetical protein